MDPIQYLPPELIFKIFSFLPFKSLKLLSQTSKSFKVFADDDINWHKLSIPCIVKYPDIELSKDNWKKNYKLLREMIYFYERTNQNVLTLNNNQLTALPESIENLIYFIRIYARNNQLTAWPESIEFLFNNRSNCYR